MRPVLRRLALIALPALILLVPASASAFPLTNCTLTLTSLDANGNQVGTATAGAADATQADPLQVEWNGTVEWAGTQGSQVIKDHHWSVSIFNIPSPLSGGDPNTAGKTDGSGTEQVGLNLPFRFTGLFFVSGSILGTGGSCSGSGWMKLNGDPFGTIPFWAFLVLVVLGLLLMLMGWRGAAVVAMIGGLIFGIGGAVGLIIFGVMVAGSWTPLAAIGGGLVLGIVVGLMGPKATPVAVA